MKATREIIAHLPANSQNPSLTRFMPQSPAPANDAAASDLADDAAAWLLSRYPGQIARLDKETRESLFSGYRDVLAAMPPGEIRRAREFSESGGASYIPDPAEFQRRGLRQDAEEQFHAAARAAGRMPAAWHSLTPRTFAAAQGMARQGWRIQECVWSSAGLQSAWRAAYRDACRREDAGEELPTPPPAAQALPQKTDRAAFKAARAGIFAALGLSPPEPPPS